MSDSVAGVYGVVAGLVLALELLYLAARRRLPTFRLRLLYHLWVANLAGLVVLYRLRPDLVRLGQISAATATLLGAVVLFAFFDALVLQRPWNRDRGPILPKLARDLLRLALLLTVGLFAATAILDQPVGPLLVSSTVVSAVIGLALQDTLKNVFAGVALDLEKPFRPGDWLLIDGHTRARVVDMSWRSTHLRTNEGLDIYEPNSSLSVSRVVNCGSGQRPIGVEIRVGLPLGVPPAEVKKALGEALEEAPGALNRPGAKVMLESFNDSSLTYFVRVWTRRVSSLANFRDGVNSRIWYELKRRGIEFPVPIRTVLMHEAPDMELQRQVKARRKAVELFSQVDVFRGLEPEVVERLAAAADRRLFDGGEQLVAEGEAGESLFLIEMGSVRVVKAYSREEGEGAELAVLEEGAFFGEMSLLTGEPRSATVIARDPCSVLELGRDALAAVLAADPAIAEQLSRSLAARRLDTSAALARRRAEPRGDREVADERSLLRRIREFFSLA